eukprot:PhF_6_TR26547/c4_g2_i8/m.38387
MISLPSPIVNIKSSLAQGGPFMIPRDCIQYILQYTDTRTTLSMFLVCRSWYHAVDRILWLGHTFYYLPEMYGDDIIRRRTIPPCINTSLSRLQDDVRWGNVDAMVLTVHDFLQNVECFPPSLKSLFLRECGHIADGCIAQITATTTLTSLISLDLHCCYRITDAGVAHVSRLTSLTSLSLRCCNLITDAGLKHIETLTLLTSLDLSSCHRITDAGLAHIRIFKVLTSLNLNSCHQITNSGLAHVATLTSLTSLHLWDCYLINDAGLEHVATLTSLTTLNLQACKLITDATLVHVAKLTSLTS